MLPHRFVDCYAVRTSIGAARRILDMTSWMAEMGLDPSEYKVEIGWKSLSYCEQGDCIKIYIDPPARRGDPFRFYLPGETRWRAVLPEWAADRRDEIVARIKEECAHYNAEWIEG